MKDKLLLQVGVDIDSLVFALVNLPEKDLFNVITAVDDMVAEYEFTEKLAEHFKAVIDKEDAYEESR